jgi:hypothetical protein
MQQEPDDIESALLVFENRVPAFKGEFPEAQAPAQGIPAFVSRVTMGTFPAFHTPILAEGVSQIATHPRGFPKKLFTGPLPCQSEQKVRLCES